MVRKPPEGLVAPLLTSHPLATSFLTQPITSANVKMLSHENLPGRYPASEFPMHSAQPLLKRFASWLLVAVITWIGGEIVSHFLNRNAGPVCYVILSRDIPAAATLCRLMGRDLTILPEVPQIASPGRKPLTREQKFPAQKRTEIYESCRSHLIGYEELFPLSSKDTRDELSRCILSCVSADNKQVESIRPIFRWIEASSATVRHNCGLFVTALAAPQIMSAIRSRYQAISVGNTPTDLQDKCTNTLHVLLRQINRLEAMLKTTTGSTCGPVALDGIGRSEIEEISKSLIR